jgi:hypothetical protein
MRNAFNLMKMSVQRTGIAVLLLILTGCASTNPFVKSVTPHWSSLQVRSDQAYDRSWDSTLDYLVKRFDMEVLSRTDGFLRTDWLYTWNGEFDAAYRVRVTLKFTPDRRTLEVKTEAQSGGEGKWEAGYDTRLRDTIQADLGILIGASAGTGDAP